MIHEVDKCIKMTWIPAANQIL